MKLSDMLQDLYDLQDAQANQLSSATTLDAVKQVTNCPGSLTGYFYSGDADDFSDALYIAGWKFHWFEAPYFFDAINRRGEVLRFIEGDIYTTDVKFGKDAY